MITSDINKKINEIINKYKGQYIENEFDLNRNKKDINYEIYLKLIRYFYAISKKDHFKVINEQTIDVSYSIEYNVTNDTGITANIVNPNESLNSINKTMFDNNSGSIHISECTSDSDMLEFDGWYTSSDYNFANKLTDNNIVELKDYKLYGRFVKIRPKVTFEGISINGINTFGISKILIKSFISCI